MKQDSQDLQRGYRAKIRIPTVLTIYAPMVYTAPCRMFLMRADTVRGQVGGGWALEISSFLERVENQGF